MADNPSSSKTFQLPASLVGRVELTRVIRELETLDESLYEQAIRIPDKPLTALDTSKLLEQLAIVNNYSLTDKDRRGKLLEALRHIDKAAPSIHISFAVETSLAFKQKIVGWMRQNLHPYLLVEVGLQPTIAIGCFVRTDNKIFDMSLRHKFNENKTVLVEKLAENKHIEPAKVLPQTPEQKTETA